MRIVLICDIHANEVGFKTVIGDIKQAAVDEIVCLWDIAALGPLPGAVIHLLRDLDSLLRVAFNQNVFGKTMENDEDRIRIFFHDKRIDGMNGRSIQ